MSYQHHIPLHLEQEDKFIFNCTSRQTLILGIGLAFASIVSSYFNFGSLRGFVGGCVAFAVVMMAAALVAFLRYRHRHLEQHALIALMYISSPRCYIRGRLLMENKPVTLLVNDEKEEDEEW